jgi:hypothetical protein
LKCVHLILALAVAVVPDVGLPVAAAEPAASLDSGRVPDWLKRAKHKTLNRVFGGARPIRTDHISYPRTVAAVFTFERVVTCATCSAPYNKLRPRGRVIRVSYDRRTHRQGAMQFCESRGLWPPRACCHRR